MTQTIGEQMAELRSGDTPEEVLAGHLADTATIVPAGSRMPGRRTSYPKRLGGFQIKLRYGLTRGEWAVDVHVGDDDQHQCRMKFKAALVAAARELTETPGGTA